MNVNIKQAACKLTTIVAYYTCKWLGVEYKQYGTDNAGEWQLISKYTDAHAHIYSFCLADFMG